MMILDGVGPGAADTNDDSPIGESELGAARAALRRAIGAAIALDVVGFEEQPTRELSELEDAVEAAVLQGRNALGLIADVTNGDDQEAPELDERHSGVHPLSVGRLADTVFVGRMVLGSVVPEVMRARVKEHWDRIDACDNARRELLQTLRAVDLALCRVADIAPNLDYYEQEAEQAQQIRVAFIKLHDAISGCDDGAELSIAEVATSLRFAGTALAKLTGRPVFRFVRVHDRQQVRAVQRRIRDWLTAHASGATTAVEGQRLWQDASNLAEFLLGINKRPELVDADRVVATRALALLDGPRPELSQAVSLLRAMRGRDAELDALLEQAHQDPEPLSERVAAVVEELGGRATSTFLGALKRS